MKIVDDLFDTETISELNFSVDNHFKNNLCFDDQIMVTNSIIDCHGLYLSPSKYFPYSQKCWNVFCLKIKKYVVDFCAEYDVDPFDVVPFSCWSERSKELSPVYGEIIWDEPDYAYDYDGYVKKNFIRSVYKLYGSSGVIIDNNDIKLKQNSLIIYNGTDYKSTNIYPPKIGECNLIFDWYINVPFDVPDWILPTT